MSLVLSIDWIGFQIIDDPRDAPRPAAQQAPIVTGIGRIEPRGAERPTAVGVSQRGVFAAIVVVERDEGKTVGQGRIARGDGFRIGRRAEAAARCTAAGGRLGRLSRGAGGQQCIDAATLPRPLRQPRERRRAGRRSAGRNQRRKRPAGGGRENSDIQAQALLRSKRQMHQPIFHFAIEHQLRFDFLPFHISRRRRGQTDGVVFQNSLHFLAALLPLFDGGDFGSVVHRRAHRAFPCEWAVR